MVDAVNSKTDCNAKLIELGNDDVLGESIEKSQILTNATSVGMAPNVDSCIIPDKKMLREDLIVSDVIYNQWKQNFLGWLRNRAARLLTVCICFYTRELKLSKSGQEKICL